MKPEQQRIAIAEVCGLSVVKSKNGGYYTVLHKTKHFPDGHEKGSFLFETNALDGIPNYLNDLNAMHDAEKVLLTTEQQNTYYANIAETTWGCQETGDRQVVFNQLTATATQRAEAFLRTLNLWTDS